MGSISPCSPGCYDVAIGGFRPDLTLILDLPIETGLARAAARRGSGDALRKPAARFPSSACTSGFLEIAQVGARALRRRSTPRRTSTTVAAAIARVVAERLGA